MTNPSAPYDPASAPYDPTTIKLIGENMETPALFVNGITTSPAGAHLIRLCLTEVFQIDETTRKYTNRGSFIIHRDDLALMVEHLTKLLAPVEPAP